MFSVFTAQEEIGVDLFFKFILTCNLRLLSEVPNVISRCSFLEVLNLVLNAMFFGFATLL